MKVSITVDFEFSGCTYHPPSVLDHRTAEELMRENGVNPTLDYQVWAYRDLLLAIARDLAGSWGALESSIRQDVADRLGYQNGVAPLPEGISADAAFAQ